MRRWLGGAVLALLGALCVFGADKDSDEATKTKMERLKVKMSVEFKDTRLDDCLKDVVSKINDKDLGKIEIKYDTGVSMNTKFSFKGDDKTAEEVLDGLLGSDLGYVVISKKGDKTDGGLLIRKSSERGMPGDPKAKGTAKNTPKEKPDKGEKVDKGKEKPAPKEDDKPKDTPKEGSDDAKEKDAASKLELIRMLVDSGKKDKAKERLAELIEKFPETKAAKEAKELLEKIK
jgi:hypothetical protein